MAEIANEAEFFRFMENNGPPSEGGKRNYLSWLRYVIELYNPNFDSLTREGVDSIFQQLKRTQQTRDKYTSNSSVSDIKSALNKYLAFVASSEQSTDVAQDINLLLTTIDTTTKSEIETRLGQGKYRKRLIEIWRGCAVTKFDRIDLLVASHIKPWNVSNNNERIDPFNGLLLSPNLDKLFDRGYISFENDGLIVISSLLTESDMIKLNITKEMYLYKVDENSIPYLEFHRSNIFV